MVDTALSNEMALRIGMAARELPDTDVVRMLRVLQAAIGLPPTEEQLARLSVKQLKMAADGEFADFDNPVLKAALACLKGERRFPDEAPPAIEAELDQGGAVRVACASNRGEQLDGHFGSCRRFLVYQVSPGALRLVAVREVDPAAVAGDKNGYRASLVGDCQLLFVVSIGGPAAARVVRTGVHPIKRPQGGDARDLLDELQRALTQGAPPWLAKAMGHSPNQRVRFPPATASA